MRITPDAMNPVRRALMPLLLTASVLTGCAGGGNYGGPINGDRALSPEEQRLQATETKIADLTRRVNGVEANRTSQNLGDDLRNLRGQVEQLRYDFDNAQRKNQEQNAALDARLKVLESAGQPAAGAVENPAVPGGYPPAAGAPAPGGLYTPPPAGQPVAPVPAAAVSPSAGADEEALYLKSFDSIKAGKYDDAIRGFRGMLDKYPQGNYSDNAWYWMGQSYFSKRDYPNALQSYKSLLEKFPASPKVPDALLNTGIVQQQQSKNDQARAAYQRVLKEYPNSQAATLARSRLDQLK
jgi:tol-pal system protein YbgF